MYIVFKLKSNNSIWKSEVVTFIYFRMKLVNYEI